MKNIKMGLYFENENGEIISKRLLKSRFSQELVKDLNSMFAMDLEEQLVETMETDMKNSDFKEILKEMLKEIK